MSPQLLQSLFAEYQQLAREYLGRSSRPTEITVSPETYRECRAEMNLPGDIELRVDVMPADWVDFWFQNGDGKSVKYGHHPDGRLPGLPARSKTPGMQRTYRRRAASHPGPRRKKDPSDGHAGRDAEA